MVKLQANAAEEEVRTSAAAQARQALQDRLQAQQQVVTAPAATDCATSVVLCPCCDISAGNFTDKFNLSIEQRHDRCVRSAFCFKLHSSDVAC